MPRGSHTPAALQRRKIDAPLLAAGLLTDRYIGEQIMKVDSGEWEQVGGNMEKGETLI